MALPSSWVCRGSCIGINDGVPVIADVTGGAALLRLLKITVLNPEQEPTPCSLPKKCPPIPSRWKCSCCQLLHKGKVIKFPVFPEYDSLELYFPEDEEDDNDVEIIEEVHPQVPQQCSNNMVAVFKKEPDDFHLSSVTVINGKGATPAEQEGHCQKVESSSICSGSSLVAGNVMTIANSISSYSIRSESPLRCSTPIKTESESADETVTVLASNQRESIEKEIRTEDVDVSGANSTSVQVDTVSLSERIDKNKAVPEAKSVLNDDVVVVENEGSISALGRSVKTAPPHASKSPMLANFEDQLLSDCGTGDNVGIASFSSDRTDRTSDTGNRDVFRSSSAFSGSDKATASDTEPLNVFSDQEDAHTNAILEAYESHPSWWSKNNELSNDSMDFLNIYKDSSNHTDFADLSGSAPEKSDARLLGLEDGGHDSRLDDDIDDSNDTGLKAPADSERRETAADDITEQSSNGSILQVEVENRRLSSNNSEPKKVSFDLTEHTISYPRNDGVVEISSGESDDDDGGDPYAILDPGVTANYSGYQNMDFDVDREDEAEELDAMPPICIDLEQEQFISSSLIDEVVIKEEEADEVVVVDDDVVCQKPAEASYTDTVSIHDEEEQSGHSEEEEDDENDELCVVEADEEVEEEEEVEEDQEQLVENINDGPLDSESNVADISHTNVESHEQPIGVQPTASSGSDDVPEEESDDNAQLLLCIDEADELADEASADSGNDDELMTNTKYTGEIEPTVTATVVDAVESVEMASVVGPVSTGELFGDLSFEDDEDETENIKLDMDVDSADYPVSTNSCALESAVSQLAAKLKASPAETSLAVCTDNEDVYMEDVDDSASSIGDDSVTRSKVIDGSNKDNDSNILEQLNSLLPIPSKRKVVEKVEEDPTESTLNQMEADVEFARQLELSSQRTLRSRAPKPLPTYSNLDVASVMCLQLDEPSMESIITKKSKRKARKRRSGRSKDCSSDSESEDDNDCVVVGELAGGSAAVPMITPGGNGTPGTTGDKKTARRRIRRSLANKSNDEVDDEEPCDNYVRMGEPLDLKGHPLCTETTDPGILAMLERRARVREYVVKSFEKGHESERFTPEYQARRGAALNASLEEMTAKVAALRIRRDNLVAQLAASGRPVDPLQQAIYYKLHPTRIHGLRRGVASSFSEYQLHLPPDEATVPDHFFDGLPFVGLVHYNQVNPRHEELEKKIEVKGPKKTEVTSPSPEKSAISLVLSKLGRAKAPELDRTLGWELNKPKKADDSAHHADQFVSCPTSVRFYPSPNALASSSGSSCLTTRILAEKRMLERKEKRKEQEQAMRDEEEAAMIAKFCEGMAENDEYIMDKSTAQMSSEDIQLRSVYADYSYLAAATNQPDVFDGSFLQGNDVIQAGAEQPDEISAAFQFCADNFGEL